MRRSRKARRGRRRSSRFCSAFAKQYRSVIAADRSRRSGWCLRLETRLVALLITCQTHADMIIRVGSALIAAIFVVMAGHPGPAFGRHEHMLVPAIWLKQARYC